ncbi:hypothetical protein K501DRAFT_184670 [Backusella circina FSU 941]|nr:hypothetical protein K501DRAFT_184670 [Backusella circina FSU 941]
MVNSSLTFLVAALVSAQAVLAHYQLVYPVSRGFSEAIEANGPCGGYDIVQSPRTQFPLKNGFAEINSEHTSYKYTINLLVNNNPTSADFTSANLKQVATGSRSYPEAACLSVDLSSANVTSGTNATIQIIYDAGDGQLYQCTDVVLADNPSSFNTSQCVNADGSSSNTTSSSSGSSSSTSKASSYTVASGLVAMAVLCASLISM